MGVPIAAAGCLGGDDDDAGPEPVGLEGELACDVCGMIIEDHPGPVGQIHFADDEPEGGRPGQFCSSTCTYEYLFAEEDGDREVLAAFLTDYSAVEYDVSEEGSDVLFSSHVEAEAFASLSALTVIAGSDVAGAMGPELIPFSEADDVDEFLAEYGGTEMAAEEVDQATVDAL